MRSKHLGFLIGAIVLCGLVVSLSGCAGSIRANLITGAGAAVSAIGIVDDGEAQLCYGTTNQSALTPVQAQTCASPIGQRIGLNALAGPNFLSPSRVPLTKHQAISQALVDAYTRLGHLNDLAETWTAGLPVPTDIASVQADVSTVTTLAATLDGSDPTVAAWLTNVNTWVGKVTNLIALFMSSPLSTAHS